MEQVAGGTRLETFADGNELYKRGLLDGDDALHSAPVRDLLHKMGYSGYKDNGGLLHGNIYTDKNGNQISREDFWKILMMKTVQKLSDKNLLLTKNPFDKSRREFFIFLNVVHKKIFSSVQGSHFPKFRL